jgi:hypothetical protein
MQDNKSFLFDIRIFQRNLREGRLSRDEHAAYLKNLPDLEGNYEDISKLVFTSEGTRISVSGESLSDAHDDSAR